MLQDIIYSLDNTFSVQKDGANTDSFNKLALPHTSQCLALGQELGH